MFDKIKAFFRTANTGKNNGFHYTGIESSVFKESYSYIIEFCDGEIINNFRIQFIGGGLPMVVHLHGVCVDGNLDHDSSVPIFNSSTGWIHGGEWVGDFRKIYLTRTSGNSDKAKKANIAKDKIEKHILNNYKRLNQQENNN